MTMQLGMVGTDGIVLASDKLWADNRTAIRTPLIGTKFRINHECGIAVACSGSMRTSEQLADEIIALTLRDANWVSNNLGAMQELGERLFSSVEQGREDARCLVVFTRPELKMYVIWTAKFDGTWGITGKATEAIAYSGDMANPAVFWGAAYYCPTPIAQMMFLAAHLILSAAPLNSAGVGGLEIALCTSDGIREVSEETLANLKAKSAALDKNIAFALLGDS